MAWKQIKIHARDINGERTSYEFIDRETAYDYLTGPKRTLSDEDEILLVTIDNKVIYSALAASTACSLDDLIAFLA